MKGFLLLLSAVPLAAVFSKALNALLDRRVAALGTAIPKASRRQQRSTGALLPLLVLGLSMALSPASAREVGFDKKVDKARPGECETSLCELMVDRELVERLWRGSSPPGVVISQSRIPTPVEERAQAPPWSRRSRPEEADRRSPRTE